MIGALGAFADRLREAVELVHQHALFFSGDEYQALTEILEAADIYLGGKVKVSDIREGIIDSGRLVDLAGQGEHNNFVDEEVRRQIAQNKRWLTRYNNLLTDIQSRFHRAVAGSAAHGKGTRERAQAATIGTSKARSRQKQAAQDVRKVLGHIDSVSEGNMVVLPVHFDGDEWHHYTYTDKRDAISAPIDFAVDADWCFEHLGRTADILIADGRVVRLRLRDPEVD